MLVAKDGSGGQVLAWHSEKGQAYHCPECEEPVFVKWCTEKVTHFSHYPENSCGYGTGEGERHLTIKAVVMEAFRSFEGVRFEAPVIQGRRADVVVPTSRLVVECQASAISPAEWEDRTQDYSNAGYHVLWVWDAARIGLDYPTRSGEVGLVPREMLLCHRMCYGQVSVFSAESRDHSGDDSAGWFSVHFTRPYGRFSGRSRYRYIMVKPLGPSVDLIRKEQEGLKLANLSPVWWKESAA